MQKNNAIFHWKQKLFFAAENQWRVSDAEWVVFWDESIFKYFWKTGISEKSQWT